MTTAAPEQTVHVVTAIPAERHKLTRLLRAQGLEVKAFGAAGEFLEAATPNTRGCVVADIHLPDMDGVALVRQLAARGCSLPVLILNGHDAVATAVRAVKAGAADLIARPYVTGRLLRAIDACLDKDREAASLAAEQLELTRRLQSLSPRERETVALVAAGKSSKAIARALGISPRTVETYRAAAKVKMGARNTSDLVRMSLTGIAHIRAAKQPAAGACETEDESALVSEAL